jgi:ribosomal protein S18 acetylase RimI-like enzyme
MSTPTQIISCNFNNPIHCNKVIDLIDAYMRDPMGGGKPMSEENKQALIEGLKNLPGAFVLFAAENNEFVGICTCFVNFSTFKAKPYINIHDLAVLPSHRGQGIGRKLLQKVIEIASERKYCKVTLEVRDDNPNAQVLYKSLGFEDCEPRMYYWVRDVK